MISGSVTMRTLGACFRRPAWPAFVLGSGVGLLLLLVPPDGWRTAVWLQLMVGWVVWPLIVVGGALAWATLGHGRAVVSGGVVSARHREILAKVVWVGPLLGLLGTMWDLAQAMEAIDPAQGIQLTLRNLTVNTGQAIRSTIVGIVLAILAGLQLRQMEEE